MHTIDQTRTISSIAQDIRKDWGNKINYGAKPYLDAMLQLDSPNDKYGFDDARSIVLYFLSNASTYRGNNAKVNKLALKQICNIK